MSWIKAFGLGVGCIGVLLSSVAHSAATFDSVQIKTSFDNLTSISCDATATRCLAVGFEFKEKELDEERVAVTMENKVYRTEDGGYTWSDPQVLSHGIYDRVLSGIEGWVEYDFALMESAMIIHCNAAGLVCFIAGPKKIDNQHYTIIHTTHDGGLNWHEAQLLPRLEYSRGRGVNGLTCDDSGRSCLLLNYPYAYTSENSGQTWSSPVLLPEPEHGYIYYDEAHMSCSASGLVCSVVAGRYGEGTPIITYITEDGGSTWSKPHVLVEQDDTGNKATETAFFSNLHCDSSGLNCIALRLKDEPYMLTRMDVYTTSNTGVTWEKTGTIDNAGGEIYEPFGSFDCDNTGQTCVAIHSPAYTEDSEARAYITHDRGQSWSSHHLETPGKSSFLSDIFCDGSGVLCQAVGVKLD